VIPLEIKELNTAMYTLCLTQKVNGILDSRVIYGNALINTLQASQLTQSIGVLENSYILKDVTMKMMLGRENYFLNLGWRSVILKTD